MSEARTWDITGKGVPIKALIGAVLLTASVLFGLDKLMDARINARLKPLVDSVQAMQEQQRQLVNVVQGVREDMIRYQERALLERERRGN